MNSNFVSGQPFVLFEGKRPSNQLPATLLFGQALTLQQKSLSDDVYLIRLPPGWTSVSTSAAVCSIKSKNNGVVLQFLVKSMDPGQLYHSSVRVSCGCPDISWKIREESAFAKVKASQSMQRPHRLVPCCPVACLLSERNTVGDRSTFFPTCHKSFAVVDIILQT